MTNVLFVESGVTKGGSFMSLYQLLGALDRTRFTPHAAFLNDTDFLDRVRALDVPTYLLKDWVYSRTVPTFIRRRLERRAIKSWTKRPQRAEAITRSCHGHLINALKKTIRQQEIDLLYLNIGINRDFYGVYAAREAKVPLVSHLRSVDGGGFTPAKAALANSVVDAYICNSGHTKRYWESLGVDPAKNRIIHNGMPEIAAEPRDLRAELGLAPEIKLVGSVARFITDKRQGYIAQCFGELCRLRDDAVLVFAGEGPCFEAVRDQVARDGLNDRVRFLGYAADPHAVIAGLDVVLEVSLGDSFGRTVPEAMSLGTAVLASDDGAIREIVEPGVNGMLGPADDPAGFAAVLDEFLRDDERRKAMAEQGRTTVRERFSIQEKAREIEAVMESVMESAPGSAAPARPADRG